jgi:hypothetical protein
MNVQVFDGTLPPQLGSLSKLQHVTIAHYCLSGPLPPFLLRGLRELETLSLQTELQRTYVNPTGEQCGLSGPVPAQWQTTQSNITVLYLAYNR